MSNVTHVRAAWSLPAARPLDELPAEVLLRIVSFVTPAAWMCLRAVPNHGVRAALSDWATNDALWARWVDEAGIAALWRPPAVDTERLHADLRADADILGVCSDCHERRAAALATAAAHQTWQSVAHVLCAACVPLRVAAARERRRAVPSALPYEVLRAVGAATALRLTDLGDVAAVRAAGDAALAVALTAVRIVRADTLDVLVRRSANTPLDALHTVVLPAAHPAAPWLDARQLYAQLCGGTNARRVARMAPPDERHDMALATVEGVMRRAWLPGPPMRAAIDRYLRTLLERPLPGAFYGYVIAWDAALSSFADLALAHVGLASDDDDSEDLP